MIVGVAGTLTTGADGGGGGGAAAGVGGAEGPPPVMDETSPGSAAVTFGRNFAASGARAARNGRMPSGFPNPS